MVSTKLTWEKRPWVADGGFMGKGYEEGRAEETRSLTLGMKLGLEYVKMEDIGRSGC